MSVFMNQVQPVRWLISELERKDASWELRMILNVSDRSVILSQIFSLEDRQFNLLNMDSELLSANSHSESD